MSAFKTVTKPGPSRALGALVVVLCLASHLDAQEVADPEEPLRYVTVAVLDFKSEVEGQENLGRNVGALLTTYLSTAENLITVERQELSALLSEQELAL